VAVVKQNDLSMYVMFVSALVFMHCCLFEQLDEAGAVEKTDTDKNMATMFDILRRKKRVRLENLIINSKSFAQTVENLFSLSFLVKDGRAEISLDENRLHYVCKMCFHLNQLNTCFVFLFCTMGTYYAVFFFSS